MKSLLKVLYTSPIVLTFLSSFPCQLRAAPTISLSLNKDTVSVNKIFACELTISWKGDADQYLIAPPHLKLPESIAEKGSSFSSTSEGEHYLLSYKYNLNAQKEGEYVITPLEISYWEKGENIEEKIKTEALHFKVTSFNILSLVRHWRLGALLTIFIGLFSVLIVLYKKKKRGSDDQRSVNNVTREMMVSELEQCKVYKLKGDWGNYLNKVLSIRNKLPLQDKGGKIMEDLDTLAEKVTYGGFRPPAEEINLIQRQLEKAFKNAFPNDKDKGFDGIKFQ